MEIPNLIEIRGQTVDILGRSYTSLGSILPSSCQPFNNLRTITVPTIQKRPANTEWSEGRELL